MSICRVTYELSEDALAREFVATGERGERGERQRVLQFDCVGLTPEDRATVYAWEKVAYNRNLATISARFAQVEQTVLRLDAEPSIPEVLEHMRRMLAEHGPAKTQADAEKADMEARSRVERQERERRAQQERDGEDEARAEFEAERKRWANEHGSAHLRRAINLEYDCTRLYLQERAALEYVGFVLDFENEAKWKSRSCPSAAALDVVDAVCQQHGKQVTSAIVVWLTDPPQAEAEGERYPFFEPCEAVAVRDRRYKSYDLVCVVL